MNSPFSMLSTLCVWVVAILGLNVSAEPRNYYHGLNRVGLFDDFVDDRVLATDIYHHWDEYLDFLPPRRARSLTSLANFKGRQIFELEIAPTVEELKTAFRFRRGEFGIMRLFGHWYVSLNRNNHTFWGRQNKSFPLKNFGELIREIDGTGQADFDLHSHPGNDDEAFLPSFGDDVALENTKDGFAYILTAKGFMRFHRPNSPKKLKKLYREWVSSSSRRTKSGARRSDGCQVRRAFFERFCGLEFVTDQYVQKQLHLTSQVEHQSQCLEALSF